MDEAIFFHFLFAFVIYPVQKAYWKTILYGKEWAFGWGYYPILVIGWSFILLWFYIGGIWADYLGLYRKDIPAAYETLGTIYISTWLIIVIWFGVKAWIAAKNEYENRIDRGDKDY